MTYISPCFQSDTILQWHQSGCTCFNRCYKSTIIHIPHLIVDVLWVYFTFQTYDCADSVIKHFLDEQKQWTEVLEQQLDSHIHAMKTSSETILQKYVTKWHKPVTVQLWQIWYDAVTWIFLRMPFCYVKKTFICSVKIRVFYVFEMFILVDLKRFFCRFVGISELS